MTIAEITNLIIGAFVLVGGVAMGLKKFGLFGNGGKKSSGNTGRSKIASEESKKEIDKLWDEKQSKEQCGIKYEILKEDIQELKDEQGYLKKLTTNIAVKVQAEIPQ